jgi:hypothetical protein
LSGALTEVDVLNNPAKGNFIGDQARDIDSIRLQNRTTVQLEAGQLSFGAYYNSKSLDHPIYQVVDQKSEDRGLFASLDLTGEVGNLPVALTLGSQARFGRGDFRQFVNVNGKAGALTSLQKARALTINSYGEARVAPVRGLWLIAGGIYTHGERQLDNRLVPARSGDAKFDGFVRTVPDHAILCQLQPVGRTARLYRTGTARDWPKWRGAAWFHAAGTAEGMDGRDWHTRQLGHRALGRQLLPRGHQGGTAAI